MAETTKDARRKIAECTGAWLKGCVDWLVKTQGGCCHLKFDTDTKNDYCVCIGWHDYTGDPKDGDSRYKLAWKIGRQSIRNVMQCDFDIDFEMPYNPETGDVDDTLETIEVVDGRPVGYRSWADLAAHMRKVARRVWREWAEEEDNND